MPNPPVRYSTPRLTFLARANLNGCVCLNHAVHCVPPMSHRSSHPLLHRCDRTTTGVQSYSQYQISLRIPSLLPAEVAISAALSTSNPPFPPTGCRPRRRIWGLTPRGSSFRTQSPSSFPNPRCHRSESNPVAVLSKAAKTKPRLATRLYADPSLTEDLRYATISTASRETELPHEPCVPLLRRSCLASFPCEAGARLFFSLSSTTYIHFPTEQGFAFLLFLPLPLPLDMHNEALPPHLPRPLQLFLFSRVARHLSGRPKEKTG